MNEMILTYVPESEYLTYDEALALAEERDRQAADAFTQSVPDSEKLPVLVTRTPDYAVILNFAPLKLSGKWKVSGEWTETLCDAPSLIPPLNPRKVWGKI